VAEQSLSETGREMRAAVYSGRGRHLFVTTVPVPVPGRKELLVRIQRSGVCGSDLSALSNPPSANLAAGATILGHEFSGDIVEIGPASADFKVGDHVTSMAFAGCGECPSCGAGSAAWCSERRSLRGAFAQYAITTVPSCWRLPESTPDSVGALAEPLAVAVHSLSLAGALTGARVLILGAGPIGILVARLANSRGASRIVISSRTAQTQRTIAALTDAMFVPLDELGSSLPGALSGPPDVVFDCAGGADTLTLATAMIRPRGRIVVVAGYQGPTWITPIDLLRKEVDIQFSVAYTSSDFDRAIEIVGHEHNSLSALITRTVTWDEFPAAVNSCVNGPRDGKLQLAPQM